MAMRLVVDWDGTVTERDTLHMVVEKFGDRAVFSKMEGVLDRQELSLQDVIRGEFATIRAPLEEVVQFLLETVRIRRGFHAFSQKYSPQLLSSGFHELIEPILARERLHLPLIANRLDPRPDGWRVLWQEKRICQTCGESCKRMKIHESDGAVIYVGDGYSDLCAAMSAHRVFARATLARVLESRGVKFEPFETFDEIGHALEAGEE